MEEAESLVKRGFRRWPIQQPMCQRLHRIHIVLIYNDLRILDDF